ncbi:DUF3089 domain-containing protein [Sphingomonas mesophila]|uniref:DUF3089 domain-containing protein n=1 Tax=Sphingomonas mesophila TaxID=2303576 RepID=UPI000E5688DB|nr:DUF3089 domain-containing protein [Sphingomonas mesophila]
MSLFAAAALFAVQAAPSATSYDTPANWLCLPGRKDACSTPLRTTALNRNGYGSTGLSPVAADPPIDCFVVYPTVSRDRGLNSDLVPGSGEERAILTSQFARFAGACRMFAPTYRSMTVGAVAFAATGGDVTGPARLAFGDIRRAWRTYLERHNQGRPFVLLGHSQGALMLQQLIAADIEGKPAAKSLKLAIIPGYNLFVPIGKRVGGTLKSTPLCAAPGETGCVLSWVSYRQGNPPPPGAIFGFANQPGMTVGCTNPGRPGARGWVDLDSYWSTRSGVPVPGGPIAWSSEGRAPTPYVRTEGLASGRCVNNGPRGYLEVRTNADPADKRTDRIGGEVGLAGFFIPGWGMHLADIQVAQGDLVRRVAEVGAEVRQGQGRARR